MLRPGALIMKQDRESPLQLQQAPAHCQLSCLSHKLSCLSHRLHSEASHGGDDNAAAHSQVWARRRV